MRLVLTERTAIPRSGEGPLRAKRSWQEVVVCVYDYFYGPEGEQFSFIRVPKIFFENEAYRSMSAEAKILYGILLDRMQLSLRNNWFDEDK